MDRDVYDRTHLLISVDHFFSGIALIFYYILLIRIDLVIQTINAESQDELNMRFRRNMLRYWRTITIYLLLIVIKRLNTFLFVIDDNLDFEGDTRVILDQILYFLIYLVDIYMIYYLNQIAKEFMKVFEFDKRKSMMVISLLLFIKVSMMPSWGLYQKLTYSGNPKFVKNGV